MKRMIIIGAVLMIGATLRAETNAPTSSLAKIIVPEVDFRKAAMSDVVQWLASGSVPVGYPAPSVRQDITRSNVTYRITWTGRDEESDVLLGAGPTITFKAVQISLLDIFKKVTVLAGATIEIGDNTITIQTKRIQPPAPPVQKESAPDPF